MATDHVLPYWVMQLITTRWCSEKAIVRTISICFGLISFMSNSTSLNTATSFSLTAFDTKSSFGFTMMVFISLSKPV